MGIPCKQLTKVLIALCDKVGSPVAYKISCMAKRGEWSDMQRVRVNPRSYTCPERFWEDALVVDFLRKAEIDGGEDLEAAAVKSFYEVERWNAATNARLSRFLPDTLYLEGPDERVHSFILNVRKEVSRILGNLPDRLTPRFSGGATVSDPSRATTIPDKMSSHPTTYPSAVLLNQYYWESGWGRASTLTPQVVRYNVFFTVLKNSQERRGCAKEASVPITLQLDVGRLYKARLLDTCNIDLRKGQDIHQYLARVASLTGRFATIDMSKASDTLARVAVKLVVRNDHYHLLDSLRATHTRVDGKLVRLEKFSSMGNGFTFELETVIFTALARTVVSERGGDPSQVSCYGDDLIVPTEFAQDTIAALRLFGFIPNVKKTFIEGPFRESCGGDFFDGVQVNTLKLEKLPDEPQEWISLANGLRRVCQGDRARWTKVYRAWRLALDALPSHIRELRGPETLGDLVIHDEDETRWKVRPTRVRGRKTKNTCADQSVPPTEIVLVEDAIYHSLQVRAYVPVPRVLSWRKWCPAVQLASCVLGLPSNGVTPRDGVSGYRLGWVDLQSNKWLPEPGR